MVKYINVLLTLLQIHLFAFITFMSYVGVKLAIYEILLPFFVVVFFVQRVKITATINTNSFKIAIKN